MLMPGRRWEMGLVAFWALLVAGSLVNNLNILDEQARETALARARMLFTVIETTRLWNAGHGGLYAPVTRQTPPNDWLDLPDRDVVIDGKPYTKINPAYMTRQISELVEAQRGISFRLTSLRPIRPGNAPDAWEAGALERFETGSAEILERTTRNGRAEFRYMARLVVVEPCLACHAKQNYRLGDVRGGLSVGIPVAQVMAEIEPQRQQTWLMHGIGFLLLSGASLAFASRLRSSWRELAAAKAEQERMVAERTAELSAANGELARSNSELQQFAYAASHDLQEPLRMMGAYAQLIDKRYGERLDDEGREFLGFMVDGATRMKAMIDDLLAYSRVGRAEIAAVPVAMDEVFDAALMNLAAAQAESGAEIMRPARLPMVWGEMPLLIRLVQNLIGNALKYRAPGRGPRIVVTADPVAGGWSFAVADNGIGVPADSRERIFLIFQRLHNRSEYPGTGIGLAIAKKIVERHNGHIWVEDNAGNGAVFRFTLPAQAGDVPSPQQGEGG